MTRGDLDIYLAYIVAIYLSSYLIWRNAEWTGMEDYDQHADCRHREA